MIPTSCVRCTHLRRLVCGQCVNISCGNYGMLLTKRGWQLIRSRVFTKNVSPCTVCKSVVPLDNSAFDPTLRGRGEGVLRRWQQYWECFLTLNIFNDCFKYQSSEHDLKTNKTETHFKLACNIKVTHPIKYSMHSLTKVVLGTSLLIHLQFLTERTATSLSQLGLILNAKILLTKHLNHNEPWIPPH